MSAFFRLKMVVYSSASVHNACNSSVLSPQTLQKFPWYFSPVGCTPEHPGYTTMHRRNGSVVCVISPNS